MRSYILITPCKNEEKSLHNLIKSVALQSIKPALWVIVDDGSTDNCPQIIEYAKREHKWIKSIRLKESKRDLSIHYSYVIKSGFDFAFKYCKENNIKYDYLGTIDADMIIPNNDIFEKKIIEFGKDSRLGIASCWLQYIDNEGILCEPPSREDTISGGGMMIRRECFEDIGGYNITHAPDSVLGVKAVLKGWKINRFNEIKIIQIRETCSAEGLKKGYVIHGASDYVLNYNPLLVIIKGLNYCLRKPHYIGIAYLYGYFSSLILRKEQTSDKEIRKYYYWQKPCKTSQYYWNKIFKSK